MIRTQQVINRYRIEQGMTRFMDGFIGRPSAQRF